MKRIFTALALVSFMGAASAATLPGKPSTLETQACPTMMNNGAHQQSPLSVFMGRMMAAMRAWLA